MTGIVGRNSPRRLDGFHGLDEVGEGGRWGGGNWLLNVGCPVGLMKGNPLGPLLRTSKGMFVIRSRRRLNGV